MADWVATRSAIGSLGTGTQAVVSLIALAAQAAATVYISKVYSSSQAPATAATPALTAEYVVIRNADAVSHSISGWTVRDAGGHVPG